MSSTTTLVAPRHRLPQLIAIAAVTVAAGGAAIAVTADERTLPHVAPFGQSTSGYDDVAANKAASMAVLGRHLTAQHPTPGPRYFDLEAHKAASMRAIGAHLAAQEAVPGPRSFDLEANKARGAR